MWAGKRNGGVVAPVINIRSGTHRMIKIVGDGTMLLVIMTTTRNCEASIRWTLSMMSRCDVRDRGAGSFSWCAVHQNPTIFSQ